MNNNNLSNIVEWAKSVIGKCETIIDNPIDIYGDSPLILNIEYISNDCCSNSDIKVEFTDGTIIVGPMPRQKPTYKDLCKDLKAGDPCLVRDDCGEGCWSIAIFNKRNDYKDVFIDIDDLCWDQCIPYEGYREYIRTSKNPI